MNFCYTCGDAHENFDPCYCSKKCYDEADDDSE